MGMKEPHIRKGNARSKGWRQTDTTPKSIEGKGDYPRGRRLARQKQTKEETSSNRDGR
jgi:hypothetical protein